MGFIGGGGLLSFIGFRNSLKKIGKRCFNGFNGFRRIAKARPTNTGNGPTKYR